jgi:predicted MFS family arabinose efflux permease
MLPVRVDLGHADASPKTNSDGSAQTGDSKILGDRTWGKGPAMTVIPGDGAEQAVIGSGEAAPGADLLSRRYKIRFLALMFTVATFNFADRAVFAAVAQSIKQDLGFTDLQLGLLQGAGFAIVYALLGLPIGWLAERVSRVRIIACATAIWSVMTVLTGGAGSFLQLLLARVGVGVGEAGFTSPTTSLSSDHFRDRRRASAMAMIMLGSPVGTLTGAVLGGWIAQHYGWRTTFLVFGIPGVILAAVVALALREPSRGLADGAATARRSAEKPALKELFKVIAAKPALLQVLIGGPVAGFGMTSISQFMAPFLIRAHHLPVAQGAFLYGVVSAVSLTIGLITGAFGTDLAGRRDRRWSAWGPAIGLTLAPLVYIAAFHAEGLTATAALLLAGGALLLCFYTPAIGMIQNMCPPHLRALAAALYSTLYSLFGLALGPTFIGFTSDHFAARHFAGGVFAAQCAGGVGGRAASAALSSACRTASAEGLRDALSVGVLVFLWAAIHFLLASRTYRRDLYRAPSEAAS